MTAVGHIVAGRNDFYAALSRGVEYAASQYGGMEFSLSFGGNEMPGYHTGPAAHMGVLIGARHSHLDNGGYCVDLSGTSTGTGPLEIADMLVEEERL